MDSFTDFDSQSLVYNQRIKNKEASKRVNRISLLLVAIFCFSTFISVAITLISQLVYGVSDTVLCPGLLDELISLYIYIIGFLAPVYLAIKIKNERASDYFNVKGKLHRSFIPYTFFVIGLSSVFLMISDFFFGSFSDAGDMPDIKGYSLLAIAVWFVSTAILPALVEEFIFRGYILNSLLPFGKGFAVCCSAVFFSLMHSKDSLLFALCAGMLFAYITLETGNIKTALLIHFINNSITCLLYICETFSPSLYGIASFAYPIIVYTLMTVGALVLAYRFNNPLSVSDEDGSCADIKAMITPVSLIVAALLLFLH